MVRTILETEKIYVSNKIQNINKVAVKAKKMRTLEIRYICLLFFNYYFSLCRLRAFWQKLSDFSNIFFLITKMKAGQRSKHLFLK